MVGFNKLLQNKNGFPVLLGVLMLVYLYLGTPLPTNFVLDKVTLFLALFVAVILVCYLFNNVNIYVAIIFVIVAFEIINKSLTPNPSNINKDVRYYSNTKSNTNVILSDKLKDSNTLEQEIVDKMVTITKQNTPGQSPRYQPLLADSAGSSKIE